MAENKKAKLSDFEFDDAQDWSFNDQPATKKKSRTTSNMGTTIDEDEDNDEGDGSVTNIDEVEVDKEQDIESNQDEDEDFFNNPNPEKKKKKAPIKKLNKSNKNDDEDNEDNDEDNLEDEDQDNEDEDEKENKKKPLKKNTKKKEDDDDDEDIEEAEDEDEDDEDNDEDEDVNNKSSKSKKSSKKKDESELSDGEFYKNFAEGLKEKGYLQTIELDEKKEEYTEEEIYELVGQDIETRLDNELDEMFENIDQEGKDLMKFLKNGGRTADFVRVYGSVLNLKDFDENNPNHVQKVLKHYHKNVLGQDDEEVEDALEIFKNKGKEQANAIKYYKIIEANEKKAKDALLVAQKVARENAKQKNDDFNQELSTVLKKTKAFKGITLTDSDQKELMPYITRPTVLHNKTSIPAFSKELAKILEGNSEESKKKLLIIAKLIKSDFDFTDLTTKVETKVARSARKSLREAKKNFKPASTQRTIKRRLEDFFD